MRSCASGVARLRSIPFADYHPQPFNIGSLFLCGCERSMDRPRQTRRSAIRLMRGGAPDPRVKVSRLIWTATSKHWSLDSAASPLRQQRDEDMVGKQRG
jgi:hypothetical protein